MTDHSDEAGSVTAARVRAAAFPRARALRVAHVTEAFGGGLQEVVRTMAETAAEEGCDVLVAHGRRPETPEDPAAIFSHERIEVRELPWARRTPIEQLRAGRALRRALAEWKPDVVHLHSSFAGLIGTIVAGGRWPVVYTPHAFASCLPGLSGSTRRLIATAERIAIARATVVGAVSQSEATAARELGAKHVRIIHNGIPELDHEPLETAKSLTMPALRPRIIAGGRIIGQRRPDACARILGALREEADVAWVGGGGETGAWGGTARETLAAAGVEVTGWLPRHEALREMARATAYLHWTAWDGQALSLLEAMACDTLVIASDIAPNREVLGPRQVCATEEEAIALLREAVSDPQVTKRMLTEQRGRRLRYGARRMAQEWLALYDEVLTAGPAEAPVAEPVPQVLATPPVMPAPPVLGGPEPAAQPSTGA